MRKYLADTTAMVIFSTCVGVIIELFIVGLSLKQSVFLRLSAVPIMLFAGRPYGIYRDWLLRHLASKWPANLSKLGGDTFANVSFQISLYAVLLLLSGATVNQVAFATGLALIINLVSGRPYGLFLDYWRRLFRIGPI